jgi:tRNA-specific 2-thiouridylase
MKNWDEEDELSGVCTTEADYKDVVHVAGKLGIPHYTVNFVEEYNKEVFEYFLKVLKRGDTPNPDVLCNRQSKFGHFYNFAINQLGADYVATGHYAKLDGCNLLRAIDESKDQTYFLHQVPTDKFAHTIFPLADLTKKQVREIAQEHGLDVATKKDSTGICFIGERNFKEFVYKYIPQSDGDIVDISSGKVMGRHTGLHGYTIGQRRGLGIGGTKDGVGSWFVVSKDMDKNLLIVQQGEQSLNSISCIVNDFNWIGDKPWQKGNTYKCTAKLRYRQQDVPVTVTHNGDTLLVQFDQLQRAVTVGQYAVFYDNTRCLGGGEIIQVNY